MLLEFQNKFHYAFYDPQLGFKADDKMMTQIISSLTYEYCDASDVEQLKSIVDHGVISRKIVFVFNGIIDMYYKSNIQPLL